MAKLALTAVGMGIGFAIGGPFGAQVGAMIGGMVGNALFSPTIKGPRISDLSVTASTYGNTIPELYGTVRMAGNVIWSTGIKEHKHKSSAGGKGGPKQVTYTYSASWAIAFCKGETKNITRIWADGKLIAGAKPNETAAPLNMTGVLEAVLSSTSKKKGKYKYRFYTGTEDQLPDSSIIADKGDGNVPAYRGLCYMVFQDMPLEDFGNRLPQITAEITREPVIATPYANLETQDSTTGDYASTPTGGQWGSRGDADWTNNQFHKLVSDSTGTYFVHYDMRTMQEIYRVPVQLVANEADMFGDPRIDGPATNGPAFNPSFSIGGNYFWANTSLHNSGCGQIWDATTGAGLGRIGRESNGFPVSLIWSSTVPFFPEGVLIGTWDAQAMWMRILNATGQSDILYQCGNLGNSAVFWNVGRFPVHLTTFPFGSAASWTPMRGQEIAPDPDAASGALGSSDMLFLNNQYTTVAGVGGWDAWVKRVHLVDMAVMTQSGPPYAMSNSFFNTDDDIKLPRPFAGEDFRALNYAFDKSDNSIVIWGDTGANNLGNGGTWRMAKYLLDEGTYLWAKKDTDLDPSLAAGPYTAAQSVGYPTDSATQSNLDGGTVGWMRPTQLYTNSAIYICDLQSGHITLGGVPSPLANYADDAWAMNAWDDNTSSIMGAPTRVFVTTQGDGVPLQAIVDDIMTKTGMLDPGIDWDSSALADIFVHGYSISREATAADCMKQLAGAYFFDGYESDYIVKFRLRGSEPVATISEKHLSWAENRDISLKETRTQELELPMRVTASYSDVARDYQQGTQSAKRNTNPFPTMHSHSEIKFELPISMSATDAKQIADKTLKMAWANRWQYELKMPWEFLKYDPTDVVQIVSDEGFTYNVRFNKLNVGVDYTIQAGATSEKPAAYTSVAVGDPGSGVPVQVVPSGGPMSLFLLNTPLLRDVDDTQGVASVFYAAAAAKSPGDFNGGYLFEATDTTGLEYANEDSFSTEPTWGTCTTALGPHFGYGMDTTTALMVRIMSVDANLAPDTLSSCTYDELLAGKNAALVGGEIVQFMTAEVQTDGRTYKLTNLLRARRGTNYATLDHKAGESFLLLDPTTMVKEVHAPAEWEAKHYFKAVPNGSFEEDATPIVVDMEPNDLKPYTPERVKCSDDGTNVTITFERRSRITNELHDGDGNLPYREGQGSLAHFVYKVYANTDLADEAWEDEFHAVDFTGQVPIYSGVSFANLTFNFPVAGITEFVVEIYEVGFVDGFPKVVHFKKVGPDWDMTELY